MLDSSRVSSILKIIAGLVVFTWSLSYFGLSKSHYAQVLQNFQGEKARVVNDFLENEIDGPFDGSSISELCANRTWTKGLLFNCDPPSSGIGHVKNAHLNCIRLAIESGAELVIPEIIRRNEKDIARVVPDSKGTVRGIPLDYFYDKQHLNRSLSTYCPQMKIYWSIDELFDTPMGNPISVSAEALGLNRIYDTVIDEPQTWAPKFKEYLDSRSDPKTRTWPFRVNVALTLYAWPTSYDTPAFVRNFGRILKLREDARKLAGSAYYAMQKEVKSRVKVVDGGAKIKGFVGVHLRTEEDIWGHAEFPPYAEQAGYYLDLIVQSNYRIVYLASGATSENITSFTERARDFNVTVVTKKDLLDPDELNYLHSLSWDQQALVDYEIMLRSSLMTGMSQSSFAWNIALRRAASMGEVGGKTVVPEAGFVRWQDSKSAIMGQDTEKQNKNMQFSIWP